MENKIASITVFSVLSWRRGLTGLSPRLCELQKVTLDHSQILFLFMFMHRKHDFHNHWLPKNTFQENYRKCIILGSQRVKQDQWKILYNNIKYVHVPTKVYSQSQELFTLILTSSPHQGPNIQCRMTLKRADPFVVKTTSHRAVMASSLSRGHITRQ